MKNKLALFLIGTIILSKIGISFILDYQYHHPGRIRNYEMRLFGHIDNYIKSNRVTSIVVVGGGNSYNIAVGSYAGGTFYGTLSDTVSMFQARLKKHHLKSNAHH